MIATRNGLKFFMSPEAENLLGQWLDLVPTIDAKIACLISAGTANEGFTFGAHDKHVVEAVPGVDHFMWRGRSVFVLLSDAKRSELDGKLLEVGAGIMIATTYTG